MNLSKFAIFQQILPSRSQSTSCLYISLYFMHFLFDPPTGLWGHLISVLSRKKKRFIHSTSTCYVLDPVLSAGDTELDKTWSLPSRSAWFKWGEEWESSCVSVVPWETCVRVQESLTEELASLKAVTTWSRVFQVASCSFSYASYVPLSCKPFFGRLSLVIQSKIYLLGEVGDPEPSLAVVVHFMLRAIS